MASSSGEERNLESMLLEKVILSDKIIKAQQRDEPDLTKDEKLTILTDILKRTPGAFLMRFGSVLDKEHLTYFDSSKNYEVQYRLKELRKPQSSRKHRNRRYQAIKVLTGTTDYFDEHSMKERYPDLYEHFIGQYLTEAQRKMIAENEQDKITLLSQIFEKSHTKKLMSGKAVESMSLSEDPLKAEEEKEMLRKEFLKAVHVMFINGEDKDFDYNEVDNNPEYDDMDMINNDCEESYFDSEEPSLVIADIDR